MTVFQTVGNTSELDAVNTVLVSAGETPLSSGTVLDTHTSPDVLVAIDLIQKVCRELCLEPWKFNTEDGRRYTPAQSGYSWTDNDGDTVSLNIFRDPTATFVSWELTPCDENRCIDLVVRLSEHTDYSFAPGVSTPVLYDKQNHRDGLEASRHPVLYLDVQYIVGYAQMPESARTYVAIVAARRFCQKALGSAEKGTFTREDEVAALRLLKREQGRPRKYNFLNNMETMEIMGRPVVSYPFERKLYNK